MCAYKYSKWIIGLGVVLFFTGIIVMQVPGTGKRDKLEQFIKEKRSQVRSGSEKQEPEMAEATSPEMAALQDFFMTFDPACGYVPQERLLRAYLDLRKHPENRINRNPESLLEWEGISSNMGGRTRAIMWDPNDPADKKVWAGGVTGGLWYRNDITSNQSYWQPVNDFWSSLSISCMTYDPNDPMTFYVGTGEAQTALITYRESSGVGDGIWKSADGGETWSLLENTINFEYITDIIVRDEDGISVIYAGVASGIYKGSTHQSEPSDGLFRSADGGYTWNQLLPDIPGYGEPYAVADIEMGADGRIYIGTMPNVDIEGGATILYSDSGLPGTWTIFDDYVNIIQNHPTYNIPGRVILASSPSSQNVVYAALAAGYTDGFIQYYGRYIIKSTNKGSTWSQKNIPETDYAKIAWHALALKVDPNNSNRIFTGGKDMWVSDNSGSDWNQISDWLLMYTGGGDEYLHCDHHAILYKPGSSNTFITCNDGGVFYTTSAGIPSPNFEEKNQGYNTLQFYTCDIHPFSGSVMYLGGLQDNGTVLYENQPVSIDNVIDGGDGAYCFFDNDELNMWITSVYYNRYTVFVNGIESSFIDYYSGIFINPADYDSKNNTLFANAVDFFGGSPNTLLRVTGIPYSPDGEYITLSTSTDVYFSQIVVSPWTTPGTTNLFLGTQTGRAYKVINAQANPQVTEITGDDFPAAYISCIAIGPSEDHLMVIFSNYGVESVWLTKDGGQHWKSKDGNLPDIPVRWALFHPENQNQALLATELGIWSTTDLFEDNITWNQEAEGFANVRVDMLSIRQPDNLVLAATHGRGFFTAYYPVDPYLAVNSNTNEKKLVVFPNPAKDHVNILLPSGMEGTGSLEIMNIDGKIVYSQKISSAKDTRKIGIDLQKLSSGNYVISLKLNNHYFNSRFLISN